VTTNSPFCLRIPFRSKEKAETSEPNPVEELLDILHIMCFPNGGIAKALAGWIISVRIRGIKDTGSTPS
jgi:hypothetical protein